MQTLVTMAGIAAYIVILSNVGVFGKYLFVGKTLTDRILAALFFSCTLFALWGLWINTTFGG